MRRPRSRGADGSRTHDPLHAMQVRYQLRHSPVVRQIVVVHLVRPKALA